MMYFSVKIMHILILTLILSSVASMFLYSLSRIPSIMRTIEGFSECGAWIKAGHTFPITSQLRFVIRERFCSPSTTCRAPWRKRQNHYIHYTIWNTWRHLIQNYQYKNNSWTSQGYNCYKGDIISAHFQYLPSLN